MAIHITRYKGQLIKGCNQKDFITKLSKAIKKDQLKLIKGGK